jgi:hypothetical protein
MVEMHAPADCDYRRLLYAECLLRHGRRRVGDMARPLRSHVVARWRTAAHGIEIRNAWQRAGRFSTASCGRCGTSDNGSTGATLSGTIRRAPLYCGHDTASGAHAGYIVTAS